MRTVGIVVSGIILSTFLNSALAETHGNVYLGFGLSSLALDGERVPEVPTRSPMHTPKIASLLLGYQFNDRWSTDISLGGDFTNNVDTSLFSINGYRFFGDKTWKPYVSAGFSSIGIDDAPIDRTEMVQVGLGISGFVSDNLELRAAYQHFFDLGDESYNDDGVTLGFNWHFGRVKTASVAQPSPQPESVPEKKEVLDTFELIVQFDYDKSDVKSVYQPQFEKIAQFLKEHPSVSLTVEGHTCSLGSEKYNQNLSERRAEAVKQILIKDYGFSADKVNTKGFGESRPVADNDTEAGRQANRRAIAVILMPRK
jgi:OOP family OmpA-OmpF porin